MLINVMLEKKFREMMSATLFAVAGIEADT